jgi:hypothetical protein
MLQQANEPVPVPYPRFLWTGLPRVHEFVWCHLGLYFNELFVDYYCIAASAWLPLWQEAGLNFWVPRTFVLPFCLIELSRFIGGSHVTQEDSMSASV